MEGAVSVAPCGAWEIGDGASPTAYAVGYDLSPALRAFTEAAGL